jgi:hypothetical protein
MIFEPRKIEGKTYSLFGNNDETSAFFSTVEKIVTGLIEKYGNENELLELLKNASGKRKHYDLFEKEILETADLKSELSPFTPHVNEHLKEQPLFSLRDRVMRLKEWQYYMYMLEFALVNRINREKFAACDNKIALLPHCLRDLMKDCKAESDGTDMLCRHCSENCYLNEISLLLADKGIKPYIWMTAYLRKIIRDNNPGKKSIGILGIACIPELINGMRACIKKGIPVVGMPLDANRCGRWMGDFYPNSINLEYLRTIIN